MGVLGVGAKVQGHVWILFEPGKTGTIAESEKFGKHARQGMDANTGFADEPLRVSRENPAIADFVAVAQVPAPFTSVTSTV